MNAERWHRVTAIFHAAVERPEAQVKDYLREACAGDAELYSEVSRMLQEHSRSGFLDRASVPPAARCVFAEGQLVSGRYRIRRFLNRGGMGEVYEAEDQDLKERVGLKTLLPEIAADAGMIARFKQEIQLSRKISHPNVCRVFDLSRHPADGSGSETTLFLTMELLAGETLSARLEREGRLESGAAFPLLRQMSEGLEAAHRAGIVHRDFKPSNVMLVPTADGGSRAVVTDFGLARSFSPKGETTATRTEGLAGTLDYMAPELLTGQSASAASDVYALGMVAYKMVAGVLPFSSDTPLAGAILRSKAPVPSPRSVVPGLDPKWDRAIVRALDGERTRRFSRPSEFIAALRGEGSSVTLSLPVMTRRKWVAAAVVLMVGVGGWVAWRGWLRARNQPSPEAAALYRKGVDDIHAGAYYAATKALGEAVRVAPHFGLAHARLAEAWVELEVLDKASQEMLFALGEDSSALSPVDRLRMEAVHRTVTKEYAVAVEKYRQVHQIDPEDEDTTLDLGRAYGKTTLIDKAIECFRQVAEGSSHNPAAWFSLALLYDRRSDTVKTDMAFERAEQLYQLTSNLEGLTELSLHRGGIADRRGNFDDAVKFLETALQSARLAGNVQEEIRAELQFANHYYQSGDSARAEQYAREALERAQASQMENFAIMGVIELGHSYRAKGDLPGAEKKYEEALALALRTNTPRMAAISRLSLASLHSRLGRSEETAKEARDALAYYEPNGFAIESVQCLVLLGRAQRNQGDLQAAQESFQRALQTAEKAGDRGSLALAHESLGSLLRVWENYPEALKHFQKQLDFSADTRGKGAAHLQLGDALRILGHYAEAHSVFDAAETEASRFPSMRLDLARAQAEMAFSEERFADAAALSRRALIEAAQDPPLMATLKRILGQAQVALGARREGLRNCQESLEATGKLGDVAALLRARLTVAQVRFDAGDRPGSLELLKEIEPDLTNRPESRWRALALRARIENQTDASARNALDDLQRLWGDSQFQSYVSRPEIHRLAAPFPGKLR